MNREQAEKLWPVLKAFAESKKVSHKFPCGGDPVEVGSILPGICDSGMFIG